MPRFGWPTVVISGGRDLTTPPAVAERIADLIPGAVLVRLATTGHSVLDTKESAALPGQAATLDTLPNRPALRLMVSAIAAAARVEAALPEVVPRLVHRATS